MERIPADIWLDIETYLNVRSRLALRQTCRATSFIGRRDIFKVIKLDPTDLKISYASGNSLFDFPTESAFDRQLRRLRYIIEKGYASLVGTVVLDSRCSAVHSRYSPDERVLDCISLISLLTAVHTVAIISPCEENDTAVFVFRLLFETVVCSSNSLRKIYTKPEFKVYGEDFIPESAQTRLPDLLSDGRSGAREELIRSSCKGIEEVRLACSFLDWDQFEHDEEAVDLEQYEPGYRDSVAAWRTLLECAQATLKTCFIHPSPLWHGSLSEFLGFEKYLQLRECDFGSTSQYGPNVSELLADQAPNLEKLSLSDAELYGSFARFFRHLSKLQLRRLNISSCYMKSQFGFNPNNVPDDEHDEVVAEGIAMGQFLQSQTRLTYFYVKNAQFVYRENFPQYQTLLQQNIVRTVCEAAPLSLQTFGFHYQNMASRLNADETAAGLEIFSGALNSLCRLPDLKTCHLQMEEIPYAFKRAVESGNLEVKTVDNLMKHPFWLDQLPDGYPMSS